MTRTDSTPPDSDRFAAGRACQQRAHALIPGGCHTYAKGDDQLPEWMAPVIERGKGCRVWDTDGNQYIEYGMGLRSVTLGHAHPRVTAAAREWLQRGANFTRPASVEVEAAEVFLDTVSTAEMVKFCKDGSTATTAAIKLARAATGRDVVALCGDHPFFSQDDWFIGSTPMNAGIPSAVTALTQTFPYGEVETLDALLTEHEVACVVMEPVRDASDPSDYLRRVREVCDRHGALLVFDEMITGFRWHRRGAQHLFGVTPDLSCFGKAMANGFSVSALCGRREVMERGGLRTEDDRVFLLSATHGAETHALAAAAETMRIYAETDVTGAMHRQGRALRNAIDAEARALGIADSFYTAGRDCNLVFVTCDPDGKPSQRYRTLFLQECVRRGLLAPSFVISAAHNDAVLTDTVEVVRGALGVYQQALNAGSVDGFLHGRPVQPVFRRRAGCVWSASASAPVAV